MVLKQRRGMRLDMEQSKVLVLIMVLIGNITAISEKLTVASIFLF